MIFKTPQNKKLSLGPIVVFCAIWILGVSSAQAAWKSVRPDKTSERVRLIVVSEQEAERSLRGIWTIVEPGQELEFSLSGEGEIRLESRPIYLDQDGSDTYGLKVALADSVRRLKRRSVWEHNVRFQGVTGQPNPGETRSVVGVGETDQVNLKWQAGQGKLVIGNRIKNNRAILCRVLLDEGVTLVGRKKSKKPKKALDQSLGLEVLLPGIGWDSNALLTAKDDPEADPESAWFLPVDIQAQFDKDLNTRTSVQAKYGFIGSFYENPILDMRKHRIKLGGETRLGSLRPRRGLDLFYGYRFTHKNDTYNGRSDREEFETTDPATGLPIALGNRFDYNEHRFAGGLRKHLGRSVVSTFTMHSLVRDYVQDFTEFPDIYSLDQDQMNLEFELKWRALQMVTLTGRFSYLTKDYEEKFSRELDGTEVEETPTSLHNTNFVFVGEYGRGAGFRAHAEIKSFSSKDQYAGYWDYSGIAIEGGLGWRWKAGHKFSASVRHSRKDYDNAHLDHDSTQDLREKEVLNVRINGDFVLSGNWEGFFQYHFKDAGNNNADFAYLRTEIIAGLNFRH
jgi:hypothetical protein